MRKLLFCTFAALVVFIIEAGPAALDALAQSERAASQQRIVVTGIIVDQSGEPVIGATVLEQDSNNGVMTDAAGRFSLELKAGANVLVTCIGYKDYSFRAAQGRPLRIVLEDDLMLIEETVVTAFATQKRVNVTGAITMVTGDDVIQAPVANVSSALVGITPASAPSRFPANRDRMRRKLPSGASPPIPETPLRSLSSMASNSPQARR